MNRPPLVITGAGGFARETAEVVAAINSVRPTWNLLGYLDDDPGLWGSEIGGLRVLAGTEWLESNDASTVVCIGSPRNFSVRQAVVERLRLAEGRYATLVHPSASLGASTTIGGGSVITAGCVTTADVAIGDHVAVMPQCVFTHDDVIGDFVTCGAGVRVAGAVTVAPGAYLGSGALIREHLRIGARSLVGMGSVVTKDVPDDEVWAGVPARFVRSSAMAGTAASTRS